MKSESKACLETQAVQEMKLVCAQAPRARAQWTKPECFSTILTAHIYTAHILSGQGRDGTTTRRRAILEYELLAAGLGT